MISAVRQAGRQLHPALLECTACQRAFATMETAAAAVVAPTAGGLHVSAAAPLGEVAALPVTVCYKCAGAGTKTVKSKTLKVKGQNVTEEVPCPVCHGSGSLPRAAGVRTAKQRPPVTAPSVGPAPAGAGVAPPPAADEELSFLAGQWRIYQKLEKHRYSTDDVVTAWAAWCVGRRLLPAPPARCVDIGCGIGSVLLMTAWLHPTARCVGVEAQPARAAQAARSAEYNLGAGCDSGRVAVLNADLRDPAVVAKAAAAAAAGAPAPGSADGGSSSGSSLPPHPLFDLITGTPPYFSVSAGGLPATEETARCLFEYRGGVEAYAAAAARLLARPHGLFVVVETALELRRSYVAAAGAGLRVVARLDVVPKTGKPPLINVLVMCAQDAPYACPGSGAVEGQGAAGAGNGATPMIPVPADLFTPRGVSPYGEDPAVWDGIHGRRGAGGKAIPGGSGASGSSAAASEAAASAVQVATAPQDASPDESRDAAAPAAGDGDDGVNTSDGAAAPAGGRKRPRQQAPKPKQQPKPYPGPLHGEVVTVITVRGPDDERTPEYCALLRDLGKPG